MSEKDRSYSTGFMQALLSIGNPERFIEEVAKLLGTRGSELEEWASDVNNLSIEIGKIIDKGVRDEWEFLFNVKNPTANFENGVGNGEESKQKRVITPSSTSVKREKKQLPQNVQGKKVIKLVDTLVDELTSLVLSSSRRMVIICGDSRSGKSTILREVRRRLKNEIEIEPVDMSRQGSSQHGSAKKEVYYMDDVDIEANAISSSSCTSICKFFKASHVVVILTCKDLSKLGAITSTCDPLIFDIDEHEPEDIVDIVSSMSMAGYSIDKDTCKHIVNMITVSGCSNRLPATIDTTIRLLYPNIKHDFRTGNIRTVNTIMSFDKDEVIDSVSTVTGVEFKPHNDNTISVISNNLKRSIIGQDEAIHSILPVLGSVASGLTDPGRPSGVLFFYGPTGVGKTELAKAIADELFNGNIHKEDMNTFSEKHSVSRLIGAPPGYVGYSEQPEIMRFIDFNNRGLILMDEIEKAHDSVTDLIMELMETGFIRDASGAKHDARGFMIIMTSNITFGKSKSTMGFETETNSKTVIDEINANGRFKKEFIGRIDQVVKFNPIDKDSLEKISKLLIDRLLERLGLVGISIIPSTETIKEVASKYDNKVGVRSMRTFVETTLKNRILHGRK